MTTNDGKKKSILAILKETKPPTLIMFACFSVYLGALAFSSFSNDSVDKAKTPEIPPPELSSDVPSGNKASNISSPTNIQVSSYDVINEFNTLRNKSVFFHHFKGLVGDQVLKDSIPYDSILLSKSLTTSPLGTPLPIQSSLLDGFPFTTFGDSSLRVINPLNSPVLAKVIYHDEFDKTNYVVRHLYIDSDSPFTLTGLLSGIYQVAVISVKDPNLAYVTQQFVIYDNVEAPNQVELLGKEILPTSIF